MAFAEGDHVKLTLSVGVPAGSCGNVTKVNRNGSCKVRIVNGPNGQPLASPVTLLAVAPGDLDYCTTHSGH